MPEHDHQAIPPELPVPRDDGAARHLTGIRLPATVLPGTDDGEISLADLDGRGVVYVYPMMARPGVTLPAGWDMIPGARGCTVETCAFRDHFAELRAVGASHVFGLSSQPGLDQKEAVARLHLPFTLLSDEGLELADRVGLPTFTVEGVRRYRRLTLVVADGVVEKVFYPIFPPERHPVEVIGWLTANPSR